MKKIAALLLLAGVLIVSIYMAFIYYIPVSDGVRSGELIRLSHKGVLIKTWEGELSQGISGAQHICCVKYSCVLPSSHFN